MRLFCLLALWFPLVGHATSILRNSGSNHYLLDSSDNAVYLTGSYYWAAANPLRQTPFDLTVYAELFADQNWNCTRLFNIEQAGGWSPLHYPWARSGPGTAGDGGLKWDLNTYDEAYFTQLTNVIAAFDARGMYCAVGLWNGFSIDWNPARWSTNLHNPLNNINGQGLVLSAVYTTNNPTWLGSMTNYLRKVVDVVNRYDNVIYEIGNEMPLQSPKFCTYMLGVLREYEATKPKQHPIIFSALSDERGNSSVTNSSADVVIPFGAGPLLPTYSTNPPAITGLKPYMLDSDHIWGGNGTITWVWRTLCRGYAGSWNLDPYGEDGVIDPNLRRAIGQARFYAQRLPLKSMNPSSTLASTTFCLADTALGYFLVYSPDLNAFTLNLPQGTYRFEWFNPSGLTSGAFGLISATGGSRSFSPPAGFLQDAALMLQPFSSGDWNAYVQAEPLVTRGTVSGTFPGVLGQSDGATQRVVEDTFGAGAGLQVQYTLHTTALAAEIQSLTIEGTVSWTQTDGTSDNLVIEIRALGPNQTFTWDPVARFPFSSSNPARYVDDQGNIVIRFTDAATFANEKKDTLTVDYLFGGVAKIGGCIPPSPTPVPILGSVGLNSVTVRWTAASGQTGYELWRASDTASMAMVGVAAAQDRLWVDSTVSPSTAYTYVVRAINACGYSDSGPLVVNTPILPALNITDVSVTEGNSGTKPLTFSVTLAPASSQTVTVNYASADAVATSGSDYSPATGSLTFAAGETAKSITVQVSGDVDSEPDETVLVNLSGPSNAVLAKAQGIGTILNDDSLPVMSVVDASANEGNSGTTPLTFIVNLVGATSQTVTVSYATADGTANFGSDYVTASGSLTFAPGETSKTVTVQVNGDGVNEPDETVLVNLSSPVNAVVSKSQGTGTIQNDDGVPTLSINDVSVTEGNSGTTPLVMTVSLTGTTSQSVTVNYATANGTGTSGSDYVVASGSLTFAPGETSKTIAVQVNGDGVNEPDETVLVNLSSPVNAVVSKSQGTGTIQNDDGVPTLSINDVSVTEGNSGTTPMVMTVSLIGATSQSVTVNYATANGTGTSGSDYVVASGSLTFAPGETSKTIAVQVNGDAVNEPDETVLVNLSSPVNAVVSKSQGTGTIQNDDGVPTLSINDVSVTEGNSGTTPLVMTVSLIGATSQSVTVNYATANGTGTSGSDYVVASGSLTFAPGETSKTVTVQVNGDAVNEADETVLVNLSSPVNAVVSKSQGTGTIQNDDGVPTLSINDVSVTEGNSGTTPLVMTVSLTGTTSQSVTVNYATANGTGTSGSDYVEASGSLTFAPGETSKTIAVQVNGDGVNEPDETVLVNLSSPVNAVVSKSQGTGTIQNDDGVPTLSINDVSVTEGNSGTTPLVMTVSLIGATSQSVTVNYATANGTGTSGSDYVEASGSLTFAPGETSKTIAVQVNGDGVNEPDETVLVNLSSPVNAVVSKSQGTGTIQNDDGVPTLSINDVSVTEGNSGTTPLVMTVSLIGATSQSVTVNYATANGTGTSGSDYVEASGSLTFAPGETSKTVTVQVNGDAVNEPDETVLVNLSSPVNAVVSKSQGTGTIQNDDGVPTLSINDVSVTEGNSGTTPLVMTVSLIGATSQSVTVNYATANGTGTSGSDYVVASGSLTFAPGETSKTVTVQVNGDAVNEPDETVLVNLSSPVNAVVSKSQGTGTIQNDDGVPTLSINDVSVTEGNSGTAPLVMTVSLIGATSQSVTVNYATANGTGTSGSDYVVASGSLTFAPGETSKTVTVQVNGDGVNEPDETMLVNLSSPVNAVVSKSQGTGTIQNDDGVPTLSINDVSVTEGNSGTKSLTLTVTLTGVTSQSVTVNYATANGTATAGSDYVTASGSLTFPSGTTSRTITVQVNGDTVYELDETLMVNLSGAVNATMSKFQGIGTIQNNDALPSLSITDVSITEGNSGTKALTLTVSLTGTTSLPATVNYATANGTASSSSDYVATNGSLTFAPGETSKSITVQINGDSINESNETVLVNLSGAGNATISKTQGTGTIQNDDAAPTLSINDVSIAEGNSGTTSMVFTVSLAGATSKTVTVNYATSNGTARSSDYSSRSGSLTFAAGEASKSITVPINGDTSNESNETLTVTLSSASNATLSKSSGTGTILNDDPVPLVAPSNINATGVTAAINLSWNDTNQSETGYEVLRANSSSGTYSRVALLAANSTSYSDTAVVRGNTYWYRVRGVNGTVTGPNSSTVSARVR